MLLMKTLVKFSLKVVSSSTNASIEELRKAKIKTLDLVNTNKNFHSMMLWNTMVKDPSKNTEEALNIVYQLLRSGEPPNLETAKNLLKEFFSIQKNMI